MRKNTIPGIYNYCDRWCERCNFTHRCAIFDDPVSLANHMREFQFPSTWNGVPESYSQTILRIRNSADSAMRRHHASTASPHERPQVENIRREHELSLKSLEYDRRVTRWLELINTCHIGAISEQMTETRVITDARDVIAWYSPFIHLKLSRAINSRITTDWWAEETGLQKDSDGSAKIALIAITHSTEAWRVLYDEMPEWEDDILHSLVTLQEIQRITHETFPDAMSFMRPGFDAHPGF